MLSTNSAQGDDIMNLAELRGNMSRQQLAQELHISKSALDKYERGERTPRDSLKKRIAAYFGKTVQEIFYDE